jgi:hypothetical protein
VDRVGGEDSDGGFEWDGAGDYEVGASLNSFVILSVAKNRAGDPYAEERAEIQLDSSLRSE